MKAYGVSQSRAWFQPIEKILQSVQRHEAEEPEARESSIHQDRGQHVSCVSE